MSFLRNISVYRRAAGFTLFELVVVVVVVAITLAILLDRLLLYQEMAEKVAMEQTVAAIRTSLHLQTASLIAKNRSDELPEFGNRNPMDWLSEKPYNYAGEVEEIPPESVVSGRWVFDKKAKKLIYFVHNGKHFRGGNNAPKQVVYRVKLLYGNNDGAGSGKPWFEGVVLEQANDFSWFR